MITTEIRYYYALSLRIELDLIYLEVMTYDISFNVSDIPCLEFCLLKLENENNIGIKAFKFRISLYEILKMILKFIHCTIILCIYFLCGHLKVLLLFHTLFICLGIFVNLSFMTANTLNHAITVLI